MCTYGAENGPILERSVLLCVFLLGYLHPKLGPHDNRTTLTGPFVVSRLCCCKVMLQYLKNHILTQNLYYNYYYPNPKYLIIGYMDPLGYVAPCIGRCFGAYGLGVEGPQRCCFRFGDCVPLGLVQNSGCRTAGQICGINSSSTCKLGYADG